MKVIPVMFGITCVVFLLSCTAFAAQAASSNLLTNPSFELEPQSDIATGWEHEQTTEGAQNYTLSTIGVVDGTYSQKISYHGQASDDSTQKFEIYQAPVSGMWAGDTLNFSVYISGSMVNAYGFLGTEAFYANRTYISEHDIIITTITETPKLYSTTYTCPAGTSYVAVYLQFPELYPTTNITVYLDSASLIDLNTSLNTVYFGLSNICYANNTVVNSRNTTQSDTIVPLSVTPSAANVTVNVTGWNNIGNYERTWTESSGTHDITTAHLIGGFPARRDIAIYRDGEAYDNTVSDSSGYVNWTYSGGFSEHTFDMYVLDISDTDAMKSDVNSMWMSSVAMIGVVVVVILTYLIILAIRNRGINTNVVVSSALALMIIMVIVYFGYGY